LAKVRLLAEFSPEIINLHTIWRPISVTTGSLNKEAGKKTSPWQLHLRRNAYP
jgi:hypothetical protein